MHMKKLLERMAKLEFVNDQIAAELAYVDHLLKAVGFQEGLKTVKAAAREIAREEHRIISEDE